MMNVEGTHGAQSVSGCCVLHKACDRIGWVRQEPCHARLRVGPNLHVHHETECKKFLLLKDELPVHCSGQQDWRAANGCPGIAINNRVSWQSLGHYNDGDFGGIKAVMIVGNVWLQQIHILVRICLTNMVSSDSIHTVTCATHHASELECGALLDQSRIGQENGSGYVWLV